MRLQSFFKASAMFLSLSSLIACSSTNDVPNVLIAPLVISVNNTTNLAAVADAQNNNLSLINTLDNTIVNGAPLITQSSSIIIPRLPQDIATFALSNGNTRIFIVGTGGFSDDNAITVLDYNPSVGINYATINDIEVGNNPNDILLGLAVNTSLGVVYVSDYSTSLIYAFDANTGDELADSPIAVQTNPGKIHWNPNANILVVSSLSTNSISVINTQDLTQAVQTLDVGDTTSSVASASNSTGTALFAIQPLTNSVVIYNLNVSTPSASTQFLPTIVPPPLGTSLTSSDVLSGAATVMTAATLPSGTLGGYFTQSTGDMGWINVVSDFTSFATGRVVPLSGQNAYGISIQNDANGPINAYFAAPGGSAVSIVNIVTNIFVGQIL